MFEGKMKMDTGQSRTRCLRTGRPRGFSLGAIGGVRGPAVTPWVSYALLLIVVAVVISPRVDAVGKGAAGEVGKDNLHRPDNGLGLLAKTCAAHCSDLNGLDLWVSISEVCSTSGTQALEAINDSESSWYTISTSTVWSFPFSAVVCGLAMTLCLFLGWRGGAKVAEGRVEQQIRRPSRKARRYPLL